MTWFVVSVHDVASATVEPSRRWIDLFEARDVQVSVLVVPGPWRGGARLDQDRQLGTWLRSLHTTGHDVAQHGWMHVEPESTPRGHAARAVGRVVSRGCSEFWHLDYAEASRRLALGQASMALCGLRPTGFVAPGWLTTRAARRAIADAGYGYTASHTTISALTTGRTWGCPVLSQRPGSSLSASATRATTTVARWMANRQRPFRIAAHPADLDDQRTTDAVLTACDVALAAGLRSLTYADVVAGRTQARTAA